MALILQIVLGIVVLVGLITIAMSAKSWHWAQMVLLLGIFFFSIGTLILGLEVVRIHQGAMTNYAQAKERKEQVEKSLDALQYGTRDNALISQVFSGEVPFDTGEEGGMPSLAAWNHRLQVLARDRGASGATFNGLATSTLRRIKSLSASPEMDPLGSTQTRSYMRSRWDPRTALHRSRAGST